VLSARARRSRRPHRKGLASDADEGVRRLKKAQYSFSTRSNSRTPSTITWSRHSLRTVLRKRSQIAFMSGARIAVRRTCAVRGSIKVGAKLGVVVANDERRELGVEGGRIPQLLSRPPRSRAATNRRRKGLGLDRRQGRRRAGRARDPGERFSPSKPRTGLVVRRASQLSGCSRCKCLATAAQIAAGRSALQRLQFSVCHWRQGRAGLIDPLWRALPPNADGSARSRCFSSGVVARARRMRRWRDAGIGRRRCGGLCGQHDGFRRHRWYRRNAHPGGWRREQQR
jgi:hypothetical protein